SGHFAVLWCFLMPRLSSPACSGGDMVGRSDAGGTSSFDGGSGGEHHTAPSPLLVKRLAQQRPPKRRSDSTRTCWRRLLEHRVRPVFSQTAEVLRQISGMPCRPRESREPSAPRPDCAALAPGTR